MMRMALELAKDNPAHEWLASKFFQHYVYVGAAMKQMGGRAHNLRDDDDGFFYDVLRRADGRFEKLRVRWLVGLIPLYAVERLDAQWIAQFPDFSSNVRWFLDNRRDLVELCVNRTRHQGVDALALTIVDLHQLRRMLQRVGDGGEFMSPFGLRSLSKSHAENPFVLDLGKVSYEPGEAVSKIKGGNSNRRGPIWFPTSLLMIESLRKLASAYGDDIVIEGGDGRRWTRWRGRWPLSWSRSAADGDEGRDGTGLRGGRYLAIEADRGASDPCLRFLGGRLAFESGWCVCLAYDWRF